MIVRIRWSAAPSAALVLASEVAPGSATAIQRFPPNRLPAEHQPASQLQQLNAAIHLCLWLTRQRYSLNGHFPGCSGKPVPECLHSGFYWAKAMQMVATIAGITREKRQLNRHHRQTNIGPFTGRMPFPSPNQQFQSKEVNDWHESVAT